MATQSSVRESLDLLRAAVDEDATSAVCAVQSVRRSFTVAIGELSLRTGRIEAALAAVERATPLLLPFDEPAESGCRLKAVWANVFWGVLVVLCLLALAGGFMAGRSWGRLVPP